MSVAVPVQEGNHHHHHHHHHHHPPLSSATINHHHSSSTTYFSAVINHQTVSESLIQLSCTTYLKCELLNCCFSGQGYWSKDNLAPEGAKLLLQAGDPESLGMKWRYWLVRTKSKNSWLENDVDGSLVHRVSAFKYNLWLIVRFHVCFHGTVRPRLNLNIVWTIGNYHRYP